MHDIEVWFLRELRVKGKAHQAAFSFMDNIEDRIGTFPKLSVFNQPDPPGPLTHQGFAFGEKYEGPGDLQIFNPGIHSNPFTVPEECVFLSLGLLSDKRSAIG
jgi:hypothetical protein